MSEQNPQHSSHAKQNPRRIDSKIHNWAKLYQVEIIIAIVGSIILWVPSLTINLQFDRNLVESGHYWLIITGQFSHFNFTHWSLDFIAIIIAAMHSPIGFNRQGAWQVGASLVVVGLGIWLFGNSDYYRGISGVVYGWLILAVLRARYVVFDRKTTQLASKLSGLKVTSKHLNVLYKIVFIGLVLLKVMSDVLGLDLFGIPGQIGANVSVSAHVFGLLSVLVILPFQYKVIFKKSEAN